MAIEHMPQIRAATEKAAEGFAKIASKVGELIEWFNGLSPSIQAAIKVIAAIAVATGPALIMFGKVVSFLGTLASGFAAICNPVTLVIAAIGALVAALVVLYNNNEDFRNKVNAAWEAVQGIISGVIDTLKVSFPALLTWQVLHGIAGVMILPALHPLRLAWLPALYRRP